MANDIKIIIGAILFTLLLIVGFAFLQTKSTKEAQEISTQQIQGVSSDPDFYNLGSVPIKGGVVAKEYKIKNTTGNTMNLSKIATSCMCTTAKIKIGDKETRFFGMEMSGDMNPPVNLELQSGEEATISVNFDPAAHGPQGVGPFDRIVWLYFKQGIKELKFSGTVVN